MRYPRPTTRQRSPRAAEAATRPGPGRTEAGLVALRVVVGGLVAAHGVQKMTHRLGGAGLAAGAEEFRRDGFRGGRLTALAAGTGQAGGGLLLAAGLLTPLAVGAVASVMTVAATVKYPHGLWVQDDGYEFPLVLIVTVAAVGLNGPGAWSLDRLAGVDWPASAGLAGCAAGVLAGLATRRMLWRANGHGVREATHGP
ncbi:DoxX family protein [Streptomyces sp. AK02-01A]|uniref:DoxX family protein n=1 Tax=Streptomyces sp. AK02-01A TaxID=3028648 RepID=UPI0029B2192E|nr:DoxX family membrane protein [Streptomyces sp. AK02-01A]MDX3851726.1 DoxX family membrane protein [Streptomyces sp. AK02-01A]